MRVLVTGSAGSVGGPTVEALGRAGHDVVPFDRALGHDLLDPEAVAKAVVGVDAVVHLAAIPNDGIVDGARTLSENVTTTWNVLDAARRLDVGRFVYMSSIQASGVSQSHREPDYLPLDDDHPDYPTMPYATSKVLGERMCAAASAATGMTTIALRPPTVLSGEDQYEKWAKRRLEVAEVDDFAWNFGSWIDADDLALAVAAAVAAPLTGHSVMFVAGDDAATLRPTLDVVAERHPGVPLHLADVDRADPFCGLVRCDRAKRLLGWAPTRRWQEWRAAHLPDGPG